MAFGNNLARARDRADLTQAELGAKIGVSSQAVSQWERGETDPELKKIPLIAKELGVPEGWLLADDADLSALEMDADGAPRPRTVKLKGYVGAGSTAHFYAVSQGDLDDVPAPEGASGKTVAVEIRGTSMGAALERWRVYYDEVQRPITPDLIGHLCVVGLPDDRVLVKKIMRTAKPGVFRLYSNDTQEPPIDSEIEWAAKVLTMLPP